MNDILSRGPRFYTPRPGQQSIPVEFQAAAYRFGHSLVRPSHRANLAGDGGRPFFGFIFDPAGERQWILSICAAAHEAPDALSGGRRSSIWRRSVGERAAAQDIDTKISSPLFNLPLGAIASGDRPPRSATNLLRHLTWSLPSGQAIARAMRVPHAQSRRTQ